jgi:DNA polymerase alpha subunit A
VAERSYHPTTIEKSNGELKIDYKWYLSNQVLPPTLRLLDVIPETTAARMAECLGLDTARFLQRELAVADDDDDDDAGTTSGSYQVGANMLGCGPYYLSRLCNQTLTLYSFLHFFINLARMTSRSFALVLLSR